jgi:CheY-like chemotaxis protein
MKDLRFLIVDDNLLNVKAMQVLLGVIGVQVERQVHEAHNG